MGSETKQSLTRWNKRLSVYGFAIRALIVFLSIGSIHIVSFFRTLAPNHSQIVSLDLVSRVSWDFFSTITLSTYYSLIFSVVAWTIYVALRIFRQFFANQEIPSDIPAPKNILGGVAGVWGVSFSTLYFDQPSIKAGMIILVPLILALVYTIEWNRFPLIRSILAPIKQPPFAFAAVSAFAAWIAATTGSALAERYKIGSNVAVITKGDTSSFHLLTFSQGGAFLINDQKQIVFLPYESVEKILLD